jgi:large subunit ribosomal protein L9
VEAYAGETGKLFGTITTKELSKIILDKTGLTVERKQINTNEAINRVGQFQAYVKFSSKVTAEFAVVVSALKEDA